MATNSVYGELLEAVERLPEEQQESLAEIIRLRLAARRREQILADVRAGLAEHAAGRTKVMSVEEIMREIRS